jgi:hypothetical protein
VKSIFFCQFGESRENSKETLIMAFYSTLRISLQFATVCDNYLCGRSSARRSDSLDFLNNFHSFNDLTKHNVLSIQPRSYNSGDEKLGPISFWVNLRRTSKRFFLLSFPAFAMDSNPGRVCFNLKFSSSNFTP